VGGRGGGLFLFDLHEKKMCEVFRDQHTTPILGVTWDPAHGSRVVSIDTLGGLFVWE